MKMYLPVVREEKVPQVQTVYNSINTSEPNVHNLSRVFVIFNLFSLFSGAKAKTVTEKLIEKEIYNNNRKIQNADKPILKARIE